MKTFSSPFSIIPCAVAVLALASVASLAEDAAVNHSDKSFITSAYQDGLAEVKMGEMGEAKAANPDVKAFATQMVTDHGAADTQLKALADTKKVEVASAPSMVAQGKAKLLDAKSGAEFDKAFINGMVADHRKAVAAFEKAAKGATDGDVKAFAEKTLPTLKGHLSMAEDLQKKVAQ